MGSVQALAGRGRPVNALIINLVKDCQESTEDPVPVLTAGPETAPS